MHNIPSTNDVIVTTAEVTAAATYEVKRGVDNNVKWNCASADTCKGNATPVNDIFRHRDFIAVTIESRKKSAGHVLRRQRMLLCAECAATKRSTPKYARCHPRCDTSQQNTRQCVTTRRDGNDVSRDVCQLPPSEFVAGQMSTSCAQCYQPQNEEPAERPLTTNESRTRGHK